MTTTLNASTAGAGGFIATSDNSGVLALQTAGTTAITVDTSQNVGIGVTPSAWSVAGGNAIQSTAGSVYSYSTSEFGLVQNAYFNGSSWIYKNTAAATKYESDSGKFAWYQTASGTAGNAITFTQAMTLDASGNLLVGTTTSSAKLTVSSASADILNLVTSGTAGGYIYTSASTSNSNAAFFIKNGSGVGSIACTSVATVYNTASDYRLKEDIQPMTGALATVAKLKPVTYKWKSNGSDGQGFIAHELQAVVPDCVTGEKDAVDAEGKAVYQGIDTSFLVATLTAALQETKALIDTQAETINALTARIVALEGK